MSWQICKTSSQDCEESRLHWEPGVVWVAGERVRGKEMEEAVTKWGKQWATAVQTEAWQNENCRLTFPSGRPDTVVDYGSFLESHNSQRSGWWHQTWLASCHEQQQGWYDNCLWSLPRPFSLLPLSQTFLPAPFLPNLSPCSLPSHRTHLESTLTQGESQTSVETN